MDIINEFNWERGGNLGKVTGLSMKSEEMPIKIEWINIKINICAKGMIKKYFLFDYYVTIVEDMIEIAYYRMNSITKMGEICPLCGIYNMDAVKQECGESY